MVLGGLLFKEATQVAIQDGGTASRQYLAAVFGEMAYGEQSRVFSQLEDYCGLDTRGMIGIVEALLHCEP